MNRDHVVKHKQTEYAAAYNIWTSLPWLIMRMALRRRGSDENELPWTPLMFLANQCLARFLRYAKPTLKLG